MSLKPGKNEEHGQPPGDHQARSDYGPADVRNRVADDEGARSGHPEEVGHGEHSVFDGAGNEVVVATTTNAEGDLVQGTGRSRDEALDEAKDLDANDIGQGFGLGKH